MKTDLTELKAYLKDKDICVLGNSRSILYHKKDIDKSEVVCRMNRGVPQGKEEYIGSRTDVVFMSTRYQPEWEKMYNAKYTLWMTECQLLVKPFVAENAIQNPPEDWRELKAEYPEKMLPSTGCIAINFLLKHIDFKSLIIYGFDFFKSGTWYNSNNNQPWHPVELEEEIICKMLAESGKKFKLIVEKK